MDEIAKLRNRMLRRLHSAGEAGCTRSRLVTGGGKAADFDRALAPLLEDNVVICRQESQARGVGAPVRRYFLLKSLTAADLGDEDADIPGLVRPPRLCRRCGAAIPYVGRKGRPPIYCTSACQANVVHEPTIRGLLERAHVNNRFPSAALQLVALDLTMRGYAFATPSAAGLTLAVFDAAGEARALKVWPLNSAGTFPGNPDDHEAVALVYRDGRIEYRGHSPVVVEAQAAEEEAPLPEEEKE
jgi:hypothetical protein